MSLVTETNQQYYQGAQVFLIPTTGTEQEFTTTFDTDLVFGSFTFFKNETREYNSLDSLHTVIAYDSFIAYRYY